MIKFALILFKIHQRHLRSTNQIFSSLFEVFNFKSIFQSAPTIKSLIGSLRLPGNNFDSSLIEGSKSALILFKIHQRNLRSTNQIFSSLFEVFNFKSISQSAPTIKSLIGSLRLPGNIFDSSLLVPLSGGRGSEDQLPLSGRSAAQIPPRKSSGRVGGQKIKSR